MMDASTERLGPVRRYTSSPWGSWRSQPWLRLAWADPASTDERPPALLEGAGPVSTPLASLAAPEGARLASAFDLASLVERPRVGDLLPIERAPATFESTGLSLASDGFGVLWTPPPKVVKDWRCRRRPVTISRVGGEVRSFPLLRCDGSIEPGALERLSVLMRPPDAIVPDGELPEEPDASARAGEWLPQVRIAQPRLVWLRQSVADAFPFTPIYIHSGYRPPYDERSKRPGTHASLHGMGRAVDIQVVGVSAATLLEVCRKLDDVGCGYYPNSTFVHVDVRKPGTGHALWIDVSGPGEPARYVDSWPGVVEKGSTAWAPGTRASDPSGEPGRVLPPGMGGAQAPP